MRVQLRAMTTRCTGKPGSLDGAQNVRRPPVGLRTQGFFSAVLVMLVLASAKSPSAQEQGSATLEGSVHDNAGHSVPEASVRVQRPSDGSAQERTTNTEGNFVFSGLKIGSYVVSASKGEQRTNEVTVSLTTGGATQHVDLTLSNGSTSSPSAMEFSDLPNFTVAAVTDWTAAGGHGSDSSLRTTEALTRETLQLKPENDHPHSGATETEQRLRTAVDRSPKDLKDNEALGRYYIQAERYADAVSPLEKAHEIAPSDQELQYELALALVRSGDPARAREQLATLRTSGDRPEWHRLAGEIDEKLGDPLAAVHEFERAVKQDPSEENYFAWGSELLLHRAIWQAKDVFESGVKTYPRSARLLTALGASLFAGAMYDEAARRLCEASELKPGDAEPYLFMGKVELASPSPLPCVEEKLERFVELQPGNPLANYYYAMAYWRQRGQKADPEALLRVETLLNKAIQADPRCSSAYLQLGNLRAAKKDYSTAVEYYRKAIDADPQMSEAHYRLGVAYDRLGKKDEAAQQFKLHDDIEKQQAAAVDRQRREIKQFLVQADPKRATPNIQH